MTQETFNFDEIIDRMNKDMFGGPSSLESATFGMPGQSQMKQGIMAIMLKEI